MRLTGGTHAVPTGSLLMVGGQTISLRPGVYQNPFGVIMVGQGTEGTQPASPNGTSQATSPGQQRQQPTPPMTVADSNGNLLGTVTSAGQLVSPAGVVLGSLRAGSAGIVTVTGVNGAVVGDLAINTATGAVTLVAAGTVGTGTGAPVTPVTPSTGGTTPTPAGAADGTPGAETAAAAPARQASEVFDANGNLVGVTVGNQATGTVQLLGRTGSVLGTVQAGQAPGSLFVVGPAGTVLGQLGINPVTRAVTLVPATSPTGPASPSPATGAASGDGMPGPSTATAPPPGQQTGMVVGDPSDRLA